MKDTAILITTFLRDETLFTCVKSIRKFYPGIAIFIADTGHESKAKNDLCLEYNCTLIGVPFDVGVCMARNEGLGRIPDNYKYVFVCEDDITFTGETRLEALRGILEKEDQIGIAGGLLKRVRGGHVTDQDYEATLHIEDDTIYLKGVEEPQWRKTGNVRYFCCDIISNVFMMRREIWKEIKWDERYRTTPEHTDYFLLLKHNTGWKVAFTDSASMEHHVQEYKTHDYLMRRMRTDGYKLLADKWGVKYYWNTWHGKWGIANPMGLYTYAKLMCPDQAKENTLTIKEEEPKIAIGIKTFMREETLFKTLDSIEKYFPYPYKIYVADDSGISDEKEYRYQQLELRGHVVIKLPYNSGLSFGRNEIIKRVKEKYILMVDDDIRLSDSDSIRKMKQVLDSADDIGLCAGIVYQENGEPYGGRAYSRGVVLEVDKGILFRHRSTGKLAKADGVLYNYADQVVNFFLAKRAIFKSVTWDNRIKIEYEHMDFFLNLKQTKWQVAVCLDAMATHDHQLKIDPLYVRHRFSAPVNYFYGKHGIERIINRYQQGVGG